ncbi:type II toxin-antitoxin system RelB/DinJ family antitoxin [Amphibacillus indicireducens]|uniref:Type II toxin-antitoxin system RelB/DinJ family antitoxin n=1 Tax=Amphibacillus indicireducens TaxID=1076330 RepID=A0ABP7V5C0_9BACI
MSRTSNITVRIEPEVKRQAEEVLGQLGIPMSNAVGLFLRQVIYQQGIPFDVKLTENKLLRIEKLDQQQFNLEIEKGFKDLTEGRFSTADRVAEKIEQGYE